MLFKDYMVSDGKCFPGLWYVRGSINSFSHLDQGIQEWTLSNLWKTAFKKFEVIWCA